VLSRTAEAAVLRRRDHHREAGPIKIGVNLIYLRPGLVGGSEVYVRALIAALANQPRLVLRLFCNRAAAPTFEAQRNLEVICVSGKPYSGFSRLVDENWTLLRHLRRHPVDILFSPSSIAAPFLPASVPQVVTIHDLQHLAAPSNFSFKERLGRAVLFRASVGRCRRVIAISDATRSDVITKLGVADEKIVTVYEGAPTLSRPSETEIRVCLTRHKLRKPFFIYPAMVAPHKNHSLLFRAFRQFSSLSAKSHELVLTGKTTSFTDETLQYAEEIGLGGMVRYLGYVPETDLAALVSSATALVYPSSFEGFGLPVIEAFRFGTPALVSTAPAVTEVAGTAAFLLDPKDESAWSDAMVRISTDVGLREALIRRGLVRSSSFTWRSAAEQTAAVFSEVLAATPGTRTRTSSGTSQ